MWNRLKFIPAVAAAALVFTGCELRNASPSSLQGDTLEFTLQNAAGELVTLSNYRGKVVLLDFWATWCGPCKAAMPGVQEIHEQYADRGVHVFGVNVWEQGDPTAYMKDNGYTYGLLLNGDAVADDLGIQGIPTFYIIGVEGEIVARHVGGGSGAADQIRTILDPYLEKHDM